MEFIMEFVEGFGLIELVVSAFLAFLGYAAKKAYPFIKESLKSIKQETNSGIISFLAEEAVSLMDERYKGDSGYEKFEQAASFLSERAKEYGIPISEEEIRASIQHGYDISKGKDGKELKYDADVEQ